MPTPILKTYKKCREVYKDTGLRSGLEVQVKDRLIRLGCPFLYEPVRIPYSNPCHYMPDFILEKQALVLEAKGWFKSGDRRKLLLVKKSHPDLDIRLIFSNSTTKIGKKSKTTYGMWCKRHDFPYVDCDIPEEWIKHTPTNEAKSALKELLGVKGTI